MGWGGGGGHLHTNVLPTRRKVYLYKKGNFEEIDKDIQNFANTLTDVIKITSVNDLWLNFKSTLLTSIEKHIPSKQVFTDLGEETPNLQQEKTHRACVSSTGIHSPDTGLFFIFIFLHYTRQAERWRDPREPRDPTVALNAHYKFTVGYLLYKSVSGGAASSSSERLSAIAPCEQHQRCSLRLPWGSGQGDHSRALGCEEMLENYDSSLSLLLLFG